MLSCIFPSSRSSLSPQKALELANIHLENARKANDPDLKLAMCIDVEAALHRMKRAVRKSLVPPTSVEDETLCNGIFTVYLERGKLLDDMGYSDEAQASISKAEKWRFAQNAVGKPGLSTTSNQSSTKLKGKLNRKDPALVPPGIFFQNVARPMVKYPLPKSDERIDSTPQLAYCLGLLPKTLSSPSSSSPTAILDKSLDQHQRAWILDTEKNADEQDRLRSLATKLIIAFIDDSLKDPSTVTEVMHLAPVLEKVHYRKLLNTFIDGIGKSTLLDLSLLEGLTQQIQSTTSDYLMTDDLARILRVLNTCLQDTHHQSTQHLYQLTLVVSRVLDAMADSKVEGLNREKLHVPLSAYLGALKSSSDPYLVYQAVYAYQALQYVPDDESPLQSVLRRTRVMVDGVSGLLTSVKNFDVSGFIDGLGQLNEGAQEVLNVAQAGFEGVSSLIKNGEGFLDSLKEGLSFSLKRAWYPALRATYALLRDGRLADFKKLVCEAPCRRNPAFEWGICQQLGEVAANPLWDDSTRRSAIDFLGEIYKNDADWGRQPHVKQWILTILIQLADLSDSSIKLHIDTLLQDLEKNGDAGKQAMYHTCINEPPCPYPLMVCSPPLASPSLLKCIQGIPDVEDDLRMLRVRRLAGRGDGVYIPPQAKASLQASNDVLFLLMENVKEFLSGDRQVLLLLGESGAGKSTFNRELECDLWSDYKKKEGRIPLLINLPAIDKPDQDLIAKHLRRNDFTEPQIREMKNYREFILICDGYDESQQSHNLYTTNQLNQPGQWKAKMVISCRSEYLPQDYKDRFQPIGQNHVAAPSLFQEAVIAPFSEGQVQDYIEQYVFQSRPLWRTKDYLEALGKVPNLLDLVKNPFLLTLSLEVLPRVVDVGQIQDLSRAKITRVALYDQFVEQWLERGKKRVGGNDLSQQAKSAFDTLVDGGFTQNGIHFLKGLAAAIYKEQAGHPVVEYSRLRDEGTWKTAFFSREDEIYLLREACPLIRNGSQYRFIHRSLLEYCFTLTVFDPEESKILRTSFVPVRRKSVSSIFSFDDQTAPEEELVSAQEPVIDHPLTWRSFAGEPSILQFLAERVQQDSHFKEQLLGMIERSKTNKEERTAAANAITILVRAGMQFNGADLKGIQIPGADLSDGEFDSSQLQGADLRKVNLRNVWLRQADLSNAQLAGVQFGEWPFLTEDSKVKSCAYSPDGRTCVMGLIDGAISVYDTTTWRKTHTLRDHAKEVTNVVYSPSGHQIASCSSDKTVRLWNVQTGELGAILRGHTKEVTSVVYSPSGQQIATGSNDKTARLWDVQTGTTGVTLSGHTDWITSVVFSPCGQQVATSCRDSTVRLWDAQTGASGPILSDHTDWVTSVVYSPCGQEIASGSRDSTVRLWDAQTGTPGPILSGHTDWVTSVVYSASGRQIASGSNDNTVRLWEAQTGIPGPVLNGHTDWLTSVAYSPSGQQVASGSHDNTVRLWDAQTGASGPTLSGHTSYVTSVVYSPSSQQIASSSYDKTVRLWDIQTGAVGPISSGHIKNVTSVVYSPSGQQVASGSQDKTVRLWDAQTGAPSAILSGHTNDVTDVVYSPCGRQIASSSQDSMVRLWDAQTGAAGPILSGHIDTVWSVVYSPCGQKIASGGDDNTVRLWDARTGAPGSILRGHTDNVMGAVYSPNGLQIASCSRDSTVRLWDTQTGVIDFVLSGHTEWVTKVVYSPDSRQVASCNGDNTVRLWDAQTGELGPIISGHTSWISSVVYSPSGQQIASCSNDETVRLWNTQTGAPGPVLSGHTNWVLTVVYSPCSQKIASGSHDNTVRLWDVDSGQCLVVVEGCHGSINSIAWNTTSSGTFFATGSEDKSVRVWQVIEKAKRCQVRLHWSSTHDRLLMWDTTIHGAHGLNGINIELLKQRGAVGKPISPLGFRGAAQKLISMASVVSQLEMQSRHSMLNTLPVASPSVGKAPKSIAPSNASQPAIESSDWLPKETYYSSAPHQARVYGKDADNLTKETSIPEEVDSTTITGDRGDPPGLMATTTSSTSSATEELEKRLQGHMELLHGQQKQSFQELKDVWKEQSIQTNERLKEQKQDLQELKNVWKEQQRSYESQIAELKVYLSTLLTTRS